MTLRDRKRANQVQIEDLEPLGRKGKILKGSPRVSSHLRLLAGQTKAAEATDVGGDIEPHKTAFDISDRSI